MLAFSSFLCAFLWGSFIGASLRRGHPSTKVHLPKGGAIFGSVLFTLPVVSLLIFGDVTLKSGIVAIIVASVGFIIGIRVGVTTYWID